MREREAAGGGGSENKILMVLKNGKQHKSQ